MSQTNKDDGKQKLSPKGTDFYLAKLGFYKKQKINIYETNIEELPNGLFYDNWVNHYYTIEKTEATPQEIELFLMAKKVHSINVMKICGVVATTVFILLITMPIFLRLLA